MADAEAKRFDAAPRTKALSSTSCPLLLQNTAETVALEFRRLVL